MTALATSLPRAWLSAGLFLAVTGLSGWLWATGGSAVISITATNPDAAGGISSVVPINPATYSVPNGNAQKIQGVDLFDITNIHSQSLNRLTVRFYILNTQDKGKVFNNPNSFLLVKVTDYDDPDVVYASASPPASEPP